MNLVLGSFVLLVDVDADVVRAMFDQVFVSRRASRQPAKSNYAATGSGSMVFMLYE